MNIAKEVNKDNLLPKEKVNKDNKKARYGLEDIILQKQRNTTNTIKKKILKSQISLTNMHTKIKILGNFIRKIKILQHFQKIK